jgi:hypothetical protein
MASQLSIRVGREVSYKESATVYRTAKILTINADGTVDLCVFTNANANGVARVQNVDPKPSAGKIFKSGIGTGSSSV